MQRVQAGNATANSELNANSCVSRLEIRTERRHMHMYRNRTTLVPN
jgi:hypothetical protein